MAETNCINCKTLLVGPYCYSCGEKKVTEKDFTIKKILEQSVDVFTHLDSKLFATFRNLLFNPGLLSVNYINGLRKPFMKPMQVFLICNIIFFLFMSDVDVFRMPANNFFYEDSYGPGGIRNIILQKMNHLHHSFDEIAIMYDGRSANAAKAFVILFIPLLAMLFSLLFIGKKIRPGKHFIFAAHIFSFVLLVMVLWTGLVSLLPINTTKHNKLFYVLPTLIFWSVYFFIAFKKFYKINTSFAIFSALISIIVLFGLIDVYRGLVSFYSLQTLH